MQDNRCNNNNSRNRMLVEKKFVAPLIILQYKEREKTASLFKNCNLSLILLLRGGGLIYPYFFLIPTEKVNFLGFFSAL